jgi:ArsR family transcriptional regulator, arsenate/arsenite/antimonite-responsive transcriptional repressor / arsenate reductase (thioredoxin)
MAASVSLPEPPHVLKLLAHDLRWQLLTALSRSDHRVQELVQLLAQPANLVSYHLKQLRIGQLVTERRSSADGRDVYYSLDLDVLRQRYFATGEALHPAFTISNALPQAQECRFGGPQARVLFLCTHNSARSQMAEGILRSLCAGSVEVHSAGSDPAHVHPYAVRALADIGIDISQQCSKHVDMFRGQVFDYIVTVCDRVRESCPTFPNDSERIHWSFADPCSAIGSEAEQYQAFTQTAVQLMTRARYLLTVIYREKGTQE